MDLYVSPETKLYDQYCSNTIILNSSTGTFSIINIPTMMNNSSHLCSQQPCLLATAQL